MESRPGSARISALTFPAAPPSRALPFFLPPTTRPAKADTKQPGLGTWSSEDTDLLDSPPAPAPDTTVAPGESDMTKVLAAKESAEARLREYLGDSAASLAKPPTAASLRHAESAARDAFDTVRASKGLYSEKEYADRITEARGQLSAVKEAQEGKAAQPGAATQRPRQQRPSHFGQRLGPGARRRHSPNRPPCRHERMGLRSDLMLPGPSPHIGRTWRMP